MYSKRDVGPVLVLGDEGHADLLAGRRPVVAEHRHVEQGRGDHEPRLPALRAARDGHVHLPLPGVVALRDHPELLLLGLREGLTEDRLQDRQLRAPRLDAEPPRRRGELADRWDRVGDVLQRAFAAFAARALAICSGEWCAGRASWTGLLTRLLTGWSFGFDFGLVDFLRRRMRCWVRSHNVVISISTRLSGPLQQSRSSER